MYCPSCGKQIPDDSRFCFQCGKPINVVSTPAPTVTEWEYAEYKIDFQPGETGWVRADAYPEPAARLYYWQNIQGDLMPVLQHDWLDQGWQPMTEIGPGCIQLEQYRSSEDQFLRGGLLGIVTGSVTGSPKFRMNGIQIKFRRPKSATAPSSGPSAEIAVPASQSSQQDQSKPDKESPESTFAPPRSTLSEQNTAFPVQHPQPPTEEERSILELLAKGLSNPEIAERLNADPVHTSLVTSDLIEKFGVKSNTELVKAAQERGFLS